jgi:large subunit ribosomal protein L13
MQKTYQPTQDEINRKWHLINARGKILGRVASEIAQYLIGKHKVNYVPHLDVGDYVVVTNADKFIVTGKKRKNKMYRRHTGYMGGLKEKTLEDLLEDKPKEAIKLAVKNMLPKNKQRKKRLARLKIFVDEDHPYDDKFKKD